MVKRAIARWRWVAAGGAVLATALSAADAYALQGTIVTPLTFLGPVTGETISFSLYLPPGYAGGTLRYPVVYHLHGLGGAHNNPNQLNTVAQSHEDAVAAFLMGPVIIVFPDGDTDSFWADSYDGTRRIETQVAREVVPHVDRNYRTLATRTQRAIQGFSMGGFGAAKFAAKFPRLFSASVIYDGALLTWAVLQQSFPSIAAAMFNNSESYFDQYSPWHWVPAQAVVLPTLVPFRQVVAVLIPSNLTFRDLLLSHGIVSEYQQTGCTHSLSCVMAAGGADSWSFIAQAFGALGSPDEASVSGARAAAWAPEAARRSSAPWSSPGHATGRPRWAPSPR